MKDGNSSVAPSTRYHPYESSSSVSATTAPSSNRCSTPLSSKAMIKELTTNYSNSSSFSPIKGGGKLGDVLQILFAMVICESLNEDGSSIPTDRTISTQTPHFIVSKQQFSNELLEGDEDPSPSSDLMESKSSEDGLING